MKNKILYCIITILLIIVFLYIGIKVGGNIKENQEEIYTYIYAYSYYDDVYPVVSTDMENASNAKVHFIYTFDEDDICIGCKVKWEFETEEQAQEFTVIEGETTVDGTNVTYEVSSQIGYTKTEILNYLSNAEYKIEM